MITPEEWFEYALSKRLIDMSPKPDFCGTAFEVDYPKEINFVDIFDEKWNKIKSYPKWLDYGTARYWIKKAGCIKHDNLREPYVSLTHEDERIIIKPNVKKSDLDKSYPKKMISAANKINPADTFFDIGFGEGNALLEAMSSNKYKMLGGIEVDKKLFDNTLNTINIPDISLDFADAANYILPNKKMHIYMANPFPNKTLESFIMNNIENIRSNDSLILYYQNYNADHLLKILGFEPVGTDRIEGYCQIYRMIEPK